jgi:hypothetical protein
MGGKRLRSPDGLLRGYQEMQRNLTLTASIGVEQFFYGVQ